MDKNPAPDIIVFTSNNCTPCKLLKKKLDALKSTIPFNIEEINISNCDSSKIQDVAHVPTIKFMKSHEKLVGDASIDDLQMMLLRNYYSSM
ncbi:MAG: thioredoxin domain-containing protein [Promethearchaeota archaeon]